MSSVLTIREVPDDVKEALAADASEHGQSLQAFLLAVLKRQAGFWRNRQLLADVEREWAAPEHWKAEVFSAIRGLALGRKTSEKVALQLVS